MKKRKVSKRIAYPWGGLIQQAPQIADSIISLFENNPDAYSEQPIMNASTIRGMTTPYSEMAYGGEIGDPIIDDTLDPSAKAARKRRRELRQPVPNNYGIYNGVIDENGLPIDVPTTQQAIGTMVEYMRNNQSPMTQRSWAPPSNVYRDRFSHHSINVTPRTIQPMVAAFGGTVDEEGQLAQLQAMADEQGISIEELIAQLQDSQNPDGMDYGDNGDLGYDEDIPPEDIPDDTEPDISEEEELGETFASGGKTHWIQKAVNPKHKGYCTPMTKSTCTPRRKALARTFKKHHGFHAYGGHVGSRPIEVEGGEAVQKPGGQTRMAHGPSHANGGININVPPGTKIYSDRVKVDGKTMAERKINREKTIKRIEKLSLKNPHDKLLQSSLQRTMQVNQAEEAEDMQLQEAMRGMQNRKQYPRGGRVPWPGWNGVDYPMQGSDNVDPFDPLAGTGLSDQPLERIPTQVPLSRGNLMGIEPIGYNTSRVQTPNIQAPNFRNTGLPNPNSTPVVENPTGDGLTTGDYVGMAGNLFNAFAPIINSRNAARATRPTINRYRGFGNEAIQANDRAQSMAATMGSNALTDIDTASNTAKARNRNSTGSVNTLRALDAVTDMGTNKAKIGARDALTRQLIGLAGVRGQYTNLRDRMEMSGQEKADIENAAATDNYFSNNAANLVNAGSQIEGLGRNLNTSHQNKVDSNLIASMTRNPIKIDNGTGRITNKNMSPEQVQGYLDFGYTIENGKLISPRKRKRA